MKNAGALKTFFLDGWLKVARNFSDIPKNIKNPVLLHFYTIRLPIFSLEAQTSKITKNDVVAKKMIEKVFA